jgi:hypothetical protein
VSMSVNCAGDCACATVDDFQCWWERVKLKGKEGKERCLKSV